MNTTSHLHVNVNSNLVGGGEMFQQKIMEQKGQGATNEAI